MSLFSADSIIRFINEGERNFVNNYKCIIERISLNINNGTNEYTIPDYIQSIRRITWKGLKMDPLTHRDYRSIFTSSISKGKPLWYIFNNIGANKIRFYPTPNETISSININLWGSEIPNRVIIEFYRVSDGINYQIPRYIRRRMLKSYVLKACFALEGQGQNLKNSQYYAMKYKGLHKLYGDLLEEISTKPRKFIVGSSNINSMNNYLPMPVWPINRFPAS